MTKDEIATLKTLRSSLEEAWWGCETPEGEEFINRMIDSVDEKLEESK